MPALHVYTWADYVKPELVQRFEAQQKCKVVIDTFDSNESMFAKMKAGATGYDVVTPSSYMVSVLNAQGLLQPLDAALIPNRKNVDPEYLKIALDPQMGHSVPYMLTNSGLAYLKSKVKDPVPSWAMLDRTDLKGRMTMLNDMRETIGAGAQVARLQPQHHGRQAARGGARRGGALEAEPREVRERAVQDGHRERGVPAGARLQRGRAAGAEGEPGRRVRWSRRRAPASPATTS